jgi:hypothetical protein
MGSPAGNDFKVQPRRAVRQDDARLETCVAATHVRLERLDLGPPRGRGLRLPTQPLSSSVAAGLPMRSLSCLLLVGVALAGCFGSNDASDERPPPLPFPLDNSAEGCVEGFVVGLVSFAQAAKLLPSGFVPRDAQGLLGTPAATGQAAVYMTTFECPTSAYNGSLLSANAGVYVEEPNVDVAANATSHFYVVAEFTTNPVILDALGQVGYNIVNAAPEITHATMPGGIVQSSSTISDGERPIASYDITAPGSDQLTDVTYFWHDTPKGLVYASYTLDVAISVGGATCSIAAGSIIEQLFGRTDCPPHTTVALTLNGGAWLSHYDYLPGVHA